MKPISDPRGAPTAKPANRTGKCIGSSILPIPGIWPVKNGKTRPRATRVPERANFRIVIFFVAVIYVTILTGAGVTCIISSNLVCIALIRIKIRVDLSVIMFYIYSASFVNM